MTSEDTSTQQSTREGKIVSTFGIGCYHFQLLSDESEDSYPKLVSDYLGSYPNIEHIEIDPLNVFRGFEGSIY